MKIAIIDDYQDVVRSLPAYAKLGTHDVVIWTDAAADIDVLAHRLAETEALVLTRERTKVTEALLSRLPKLRLISQNGQVPHIDLAACTRHGVTVSSALGGRPSYPTAELTWGLIIAAMRNLPFEIDALKHGRWQSTIGLGLRGRTLGIFGFGKLGGLVAGVGQAFGMELLAWGRDTSRAAAGAAGVPFASSKADLFERADVLSLHLRLVGGTRAIVGPDDLARMKPTALLVNTSRAELIAPGALVAALRAGRPGKAAVDVYETEPLTNAEDDLLRQPNALCTPHLGYVERDNYEASYATAFDQILAFAAASPINVQNPAVLEH